MIKLRLLIHIIFTNVVGNAVVHMDISLTVNGQPVRIGEKLCPQFLITAEFPVVAVEAAPENGATVIVKELFCDHTRVIGLYIHHADSIVTFAADGDGIASYNI